MAAFSSKHPQQVRIAIAIPVCNEAEVIERCLMSLAAQTFSGSFAVFSLLNKCYDGTERIIRKVQLRLPFHLSVEERWFEPADANAGVARRAAMLLAANAVGQEGLLLTTDADTCVSPDWVAENVAEINAGADAVAGMAIIDPADAAALPARLIDDEARTEVYATLLDEIAWLLDRDEADPWPRHTEHSGASIAVRANWHGRVGGIPSVSLGEDRAFFEQLRQADARIRHSRNVTVTVSGRTSGRAKGGMADTISRRLQLPDPYLDDRLEPAEVWARRIQWRAAVRAAWSDHVFDDRMCGLATALHVPIATVQRSLAAETFGQGWDLLQRRSPLLCRHLVPASDLEREIKVATCIVERIRFRRRSSARGYQGDIAAFAGADGSSDPAWYARGNDEPPRRRFAPPP